MITMKINTKRVESMLTGYQRTIPKGIELGVDELTKFSAKMYFHQALRAGITNWRGNFFGTMMSQMQKPRKYSRYSNYVVMPVYMDKLDSMPPHWVSFKRHPLIEQWARDKLGLAGRVMKKIFVRPHPFVEKAESIIKGNIRRFMEKRVNQAIGRKGK